jgi:N12 class adenine-specific DNA methylase
MGIGNFFGLMPQDLAANSDLTGIELDEMTAAMAKMLYPKANIQRMGYEKSKTADGFYDIVIGNWPFAADGPVDRRYNKYRLSLHDYFFVKALDQVREGGFVIGITSSGTMDKLGKLARTQMAKRGTLVAAYRMPMGAFKEYAGTAVVADILVFQKHDGTVRDQHDAPWMETVPLLDARGEEVTAADGRVIKVNEYWSHRPGNVLGNMTVGHGTTQGREGMIVERPEKYEDVLNAIPGKLPENIMTARDNADHVRYVSNNTKERQNSVVAQDGELYVVSGERLAILDDVASFSVKDAKKTAARKQEIESLVWIGKEYGKLLDAEREGKPETEDIRKALNSAYKDFVSKYGHINKSFALTILQKAKDPFAPALASLESNVGTKKRPSYKPALVLTQSTQRAKRSIKSPSIADALVMVLNENARVVNIEAIAEKAGTTVDAVKDELFKKNAIFETPAGHFEVRDIYLSGNVRQKLKEAEDAKERGMDMDRNIEALKKVIPADVPYFSIEANLGATWIPASVYQDFIRETAGLPEDVTRGIRLTPSINGWIVKFDDSGAINRREEVRTLWSVSGAPFTKIINAAFSGQTIVVKYKDEDGNDVVDQEASEQANAKVEALREALKDWIWKDVDRRVSLERQYNDTMNAFATPDYDGSFLSFDGMMLRLGESEFDLRAHQVNAIWMGLANGRGLYAHEVGTGKTFTMGGIAIESRKYGIARKPLILAHNANSQSVAADIQSMYPGAHILYIDNLSPSDIDTRLYQIANDDWDAIVIPHSLIKRLTLTKETLDRIAAEEIMALEEEAIASAAEEGFDIEGILDDEVELRKVRGATTAKQLVKQRNRILANIEKQAQASSRENAIPFESLGIDMIIIDEAHEFKKPPLSTKMRVKGLNTESSDRSIALNFLTSYVKELNSGKGVHIFTGTPITNTLNEIYNHMRYVMSDEMDRIGVLSWDAWFNTFASVETDIERTAAGQYEAVSRLSSFHNVSELRRMAGQYMDVVFAEDMPEFIPRRTKSGKTLQDANLTEAEQDELLNGRADGEIPIGRPYKKIINDVGQMSPEQRAILNDIIERSNSFRNAEPRERRQIMLSGDPRSPLIVETDAANAGFDARRYDMTLPDRPGNKINRCVDHVLQHYANDSMSTQVIFMEKGYNDTSERTVGDMGARYKTTVQTFNAAKDIVDKLVAGGIPREEIALVVGKVSKKKRKEIADAMNAGTIRVVIGQTGTLGTGVNMQENLRAMHHLDAPWMPGDLEQRNGRGHRQGNRWNTVLEYRYITDNIDARRWQVLAKKQRIIIDFLKAKEGVRSISGDVLDLNEESELEDINASFAQAAGDSRVLVRAKLQKDVEKLERKQRAHDFGIVDAKDKVKSLTKEIPALKKQVEDLKADADHYDSVINEPYAITIDGVTYLKRDAAGAAMEKVNLRESIANQTKKSTEDKVIGSFRGFEIVAAHVGIRGVEYYLHRNEYTAISPSIGSIDARLRGLRKAVNDLTSELEDKEEAITRFEQVAKEPFGQAEILENKRRLLAQIERDLADNPNPPPSWLSQGAPVDTYVYYKGRRYEVEGHKAGEFGYYVSLVDGDQHEVVSYLDVTDENNQPLYQEMGPPGTETPSEEDVLSTDVSLAREPPPPVTPGKGQFLIATMDGPKYVAGKPVAIEGWEEFDFFIHKNEPAGNWAISEKTTGQRLVTHSTQAKAKEALEDQLRHGIKTASAFQGLLDRAGKITPPQFSTEAVLPGQGVSLEDIKARFKHQDVGLSPDGSIWIRMKNGMGVIIRTVKDFGKEDYEIAVQTGRMTSGGKILGKYQDQTITLSRDYASQGTLDHELEHLLEDIGLISERDIKAMDRKIAELAGIENALRFQMSEDPAENRANFLAQVLAEREKHRGTLLGRIAQKVADFIDALLHVGRSSVRGIARGVESGELFGKKGEASGEQHTGQFSTSDDLDPIEALPPHVRERFKKNRGIGNTKLIDVLRRVGQKVGEEMRHFPGLARVEDVSLRAILKDKLRVHQEIPSVASDEAARAIHSFIKGLSKREYELYSQRIILGDEVRSIKAGQRTEDRLPFGFKSFQEVIDAHAATDAMVQANKKVKAAFEARKAFQANLAKDLVAEGIMGKEILEDPEYFHHQIMKYWGNKAETDHKGAGLTSADARSHWRPWMAKRTGSPLDYNTEYVEAELTSMAQMIGQVRTKRSLKEIQALADKTLELRRAAKAANIAEVYRIYDQMAADGTWPINPKTGLPKDPLSPFKQKIAIGISRILKGVNDGDIQVPAEFNDLLDAIQDADLAGTEVNHPDLLRFMESLMDKDLPGAKSAAMVFKGITGRESFVRETLGSKYKTEKDLIPKGYVQWVPDKGKGWFYVSTVAEKVLNEVFEGSRDLRSEDVKKVLAKAETPYWIIPEGLAHTMDNFRPKAADTMIAVAARKTMAAWKQYILLNPLSVMIYNINNMSGDLDIIMAYDPAILKFAKGSLQDLRKWMNRQAGTADEELNLARDLAVIGSGFAVQEVEDTISALGANKVLDDILLEKKPSLAARYWSKVKGLSTLRENVLRLAAYRRFKDRFAKGERNFYGDSNPKEIDALVAKGMFDEAAAKMARELLGDYGAISRHGEHIRASMIPFYSWMEINLPRYVYMMRNLKYEGGDLSGNRARLVGVGAKRAAMFGIKAFTLYTAISMWNGLFFPDEEDELGASGRRQLHLILPGRGPGGEIRTIRFQGALSDALSWFGLEDAPSDVRDIAKGKKGALDMLEEAGKAIVNKGIQGIRPDLKVGAEMLTGKKLYPDVFAPGPVRDRVEHILSTVKLQKPYQWATGKPRQGRDTAEQIKNDLLSIISYSTDPGSQAYYDVKALIRKWEDTQGIERSYGSPTSRGNALYYYRTAMRYGDIETAEEYLRKYYALGGTRAGRRKSIDLAHPLGNLSRRNQRAFLMTLDEAEKETYRRAVEWYNRTYKKERKN